MGLLAAPPARSAAVPLAAACQARLPGLYAGWHAAPAHATQPSQRGGRQGSQAFAVAAAGRRGGSGGGGGKRKAKKPKIDEAAAFEQLMCDWDDAFAADCEDADKAALVAGLSQQGYAQQGRGFVFVRSRLEKGSGGSRKAATSKGFGAAPPAAEKGVPLPTNPQLRLLDWRADYVPASQLDAMGGVFSAAGGGAALVPDSASLLAGDGGSSGRGSSGSGAAMGPDAAVLEELQRVLRGQDLAQLRAYVGLPPPGSPAAAGASSSGGGDAAAAAAAAEAYVEVADGGMMGVRPYQPEAGEVVVLLVARINGTPAVGADVFAVEREDDGSTVTSLQLPDGWEEALRGGGGSGDGDGLQPLVA